MINIPIPTKTSDFSGFIAEIVTFDIPELDMENVMYFENFQCPEYDEIFTDLIQETYSDYTLISGYEWRELRDSLWNDPYFNRILLLEQMSPSDYKKYLKLAST